MASQLSSGDLISDRYASALYDLASEKKLVDVVLDDLLFIQSTIKNNKDLKLVIKSPLIKSNDKLEILQNILKSKNPNELSLTFLKVLSKNKRFQKTVDIIAQFKNINAHKRGDFLADITSAEKLSNEQQDNIKEQLRKILGDKLSLSYKVDEQIIGGLIIKVGSKMIDTSLSNKINKLKIAMKGA